MKPSPEWMQRRERGSLALLRLMCRTSLLAGRGPSRIVLHGIALYFSLTAPQARRASRAYLKKALGRPPSFRDLFRHILHFSTTIHDRIYQLNDRQDLFEIRIFGAEPLHSLHVGGKGCFLFGAHLGSFEMLRSVARDHGGLRVSVAMFPENARQIHDTLASINPKVVLDLIALGKIDSMLEIHRRIEEGAMVGILADRASGPDRYLELPFLGKPARFPTGPFRMAAMLRHPVFFMAGLYQGGNRYDVHFELLNDFSSSASREEEIRLTMERYVAALERHCRESPFNWFNFYDFWKAPDCENP
ncbi:MAG: acyl-CoA synthetase [Burkholderiales bacterium]|nr:acyl-CoA synthetase [Burkholderiales bacterium]